MKLIAEALENLSPEVRAELAKPYEPRDPRHAEIVAGEDPKWYVVEVFASAQAEVAEVLAGHRFGVYVPEVEETIVRRGRTFDRRVPMFSGYVFVFMWYSDQHWQCISGIPGVVEIVGALTDAEIDVVRFEENKKRPVIIDVEPEPEPEPVVQTKSKKKRRWKNRKSAKAKAKAAAKPKVITEAYLRSQIITTRAWSAFDDVLQLDSEGRNQTLMRALGLS
ncbi:transcription termination/antitermination protein NusG [Bradyrhizobium yuanmingense]|uniref:transcription termination/antitermination protein NusG n=1 Tax=Bradyrhizobium yuanmingense TaxID=108015 RepID=UPI0004BBF2A8|nr:transcription termination/antitermination NusG family protein [Bradyrhizobium yuanmingense]